MSSSFVYSPLAEGHIRVLQVQRHSNHDGAVYELQDKLFDAKLRFRAISYAWGKFELKHSVQCNGKILPITDSVSEVLSSTVIGSLCDELPIWIDFICINQSDDVEKAQQVRKMGLVYSLAEEVVIWLGPASSDSDLAMDTIRALSEKRALISKENYLGFATSSETLQDAGLANATEDIRSALGSLLCRTWFERLWVVQEVVLAQRRRLVCGSQVMVWEDFVEAIGAIARFQQHQFSIIFPNADSGVRNLEGIFEIKHVVKIHNSVTDYVRSAALLDIGQRKNVTDPRDRIFGVLGLASSDFREKVKVDYSQQDPSALLRLYIESGKACIEEDTSLSLLFMISGREKNPGLPSWCPNLDSPDHRRLVIHSKWRAGIRTLTEGEGQISAWFEPDSDDLYAPGCRVGLVDQVVSSTFCWSSLERDAEISDTEDARKNLLWQHECLALLREVLSEEYCEEEEVIPISYILTLCEGFLNPFENDEDIFRAAYEGTMSLWQSAANSVVPNADSMNQRIRSAIHHYNGRLMQNCLGRKFFSTSGGYVGMGPPETQAGDEVYILYGAEPLYLLRCIEEHIEILGNVYIHELMDLEETPEEVMEENEIVTIQ